VPQMVEGFTVKPCDIRLLSCMLADTVTWAEWTERDVNSETRSSNLLA
jgi:hypothetical protein